MNEERFPIVEVFFLGNPLSASNYFMGENKGDINKRVSMFYKLIILVLKIASRGNVYKG
ncbi:hypothetical protein [Ureibacillus thermophilus]|uniref:hypothetical protein n=1 Tax=Ureibacillus thermophilus TaxID=367743 RepID=UPI001ABF33A1|nr:hypothetical protein [Ureibacillus thermophilus]